MDDRRCMHITVDVYQEDGNVVVETVRNDLVWSDQAGDWVPVYSGKAASHDTESVPAYRIDDSLVSDEINRQIINAQDAPWGS